MVDVKKNNPNGAIEAKKFVLSAIISAFMLVIGEQITIVIFSPNFFADIAEWIWNLFVSMSFILVFATAYALIGAICWQSIANHLNPIGWIKTTVSSSREKAQKDVENAATIFGMVGALGFLTIAIFLAQLHFSTAYNNKPLAAFVFLFVGFLILMFSMSVFSGLFKISKPIFSVISKLLPGKLVLIELTTIAFAAIGMVVFLSYKNQYLFDILDYRPFLLIGLFFFFQFILYIFFSHEVGLYFTEILTSYVSLGGWLINIAIMLSITILAYSSQPRVASILRNYSVLTKQVILAVQGIVDKDKDGFSPVLKGGDCNDNNPFVHPMAFDIAENGLDEDCFGGDAQRIRKIKKKRDETLALRIETIRDKYNIILISIDALRNDHLGYMGYHRDTSPEIDALAKKSVVFSNAYAQAPNTPQSIPSILTGMYPSQISWSEYVNFPKVLNKTKTVMDTAKDYGYHVAGIFSYWYFDRRNLKRNADWWDNRAFRQRDHAERVGTADLVTNNAIEHLERIEEDEENPLFMWLHYFDPHFFYVKHKGMDFGKKQIDLYDGEIKYSSQEVGRFLDYFKKTKWFENSIIILTADHGEEFKEHGMKFHGSQIYDESVQVPLIIYSPKLKPQVINDPVALVDIVPTLHDLTGFDEITDQLQGKSLLPKMLGIKDNQPNQVFIEKLKSPTFPWSMQALIENEWKLIYRANEQRFELYNLKIDAHEMRDLVNDLPEKANEMRVKMNEFKQRNLTSDTGWYTIARKQSKK